MTAVLPGGGARPAPPPPLRVVDQGRRRPAHRRRRTRAAAVSVALVAVALFGLVTSHVVLTQGQFRLERLRERAAGEQARYERLRLQVAELESPARVVAAAHERLGMVPPPGVTYLSPVGPASAPDGEQRDDEAGANAADDWSDVKRQLASRP